MSKLIKRPQVALLGALVIVMCALAVTIGLTPDPSVRGKYPSIEGQSGSRRPTQIPAPVPAVFRFAPSVGDAPDEIASSVPPRDAVSDEGSPIADLAPDEEDELVAWLDDASLVEYGTSSPFTECLDCDDQPSFFARMFGSGGAPLGSYGGGGFGGGGGVGGGGGSGGGSSGARSLSSIGGDISSIASNGGGGGGNAGQSGGRGISGNVLVINFKPNGLNGAATQQEVVTVPEPSSLLLTGIGIAGVVARRRSARKRQS